MQIEDVEYSTFNMEYTAVLERQCNTYLLIHRCYNIDPNASKVTIDSDLQRVLSIKTPVATLATDSYRSNL